MATINQQIAANADDAYEVEGTSTVDTAEDSAYNVGTAAAATSPDRYFGWRFPATGIPEGSTINSATFRMIKSVTEWKRMAGTLYADDSAAPAALTSGTLSGRTKTTASTAFDDDFNEVDGATRDFTITSIVQEVVNISGFNGTIIILAAGDTAFSFAAKQFHAYGESPSNAARLLVDYTPAVTDDEDDGAKGSSRGFSRGMSRGLST